MRISNTCLLLVISCSVVYGCGGHTEALQSDTGSLPHHPYLDLEFVRQFEITWGDGAVVPKDMVWAISGHSVARGRVTTADILLDGRAKIGGYELEGRYWLTFQALQTQTIWVYSGTKIGLGDTRRMLTIREFRDKNPE